MKTTHLRSTVLIGLLIIVTCSAMAATKLKATRPVITPDHDAIITLSGQLPQSKIHLNGDGALSFGITMTARDNGDEQITKNHDPVDLIIVLDRSGSMNGSKIGDAKEAISQIIHSLGEIDRLGLISYSDTVIRHAPLLTMTTGNRNRLITQVNDIQAGGGTNLGAGLQESITLLNSSDRPGSSRILLISDGMANQGITDPVALGKMAAGVVSKEASLSAIGVGVEFNEHLMTTLADQGSGVYHFLEHPAGFAEIFQEELSRTRVAAATGIEIHIPLPQGMTLREAGGYPVENRNGAGIFRPGNLLPGQSRTIFVTLQVPTNREQTFTIDKISAHFLHNSVRKSALLDQSYQVTCTGDRQESLASIDKKVWEKKVVQDDINRLKDEVARDIGSGRKDQALERIRQYSTEQETINVTVGSETVAQAIEELDSLKEEVNQTFVGAPAAVAAKQKKASKTLQHKSYEGRRAIQ